MFGGNLLPSANVTNVTGIHILPQPSAFITIDFARRVWHYKWMMCCQHFLLGEEAVVFFSSPLTCPWKATSFFSSWQFLEKQSFYKGRIHSFISYTHPRTRVGIEMMPRHVWFGKSLCFVFCFILFSCLACKWHFIFYLQTHKLDTYLFRYLEITLFGALKYFAFISFCVCFVLHSTFDSITLNFLSTLQLFVFFA